MLQDEQDSRKDEQDRLQDRQQRLLHEQDSLQDWQNDKKRKHKRREKEPHPKGNVILSYIKIELGTSNLQLDSWKLWNQIKMNKQMYVHCSRQYFCHSDKVKTGTF